MSHDPSSPSSSPAKRWQGEYVYARILAFSAILHTTLIWLFQMVPSPATPPPTNRMAAPLLIEAPKPKAISPTPSRQGLPLPVVSHTSTKPPPHRITRPRPPKKHLLSILQTKWTQERGPGDWFRIQLPATPKTAPAIAHNRPSFRRKKPIPQHQTQPTKQTHPRYTQHVVPRPQPPSTQTITQRDNTKWLFPRSYQRRHLAPLFATKKEQ